MTLRIVDDTIELFGRPVARLLPGVSLTVRDRLTAVFDAVDEGRVAELEDRVDELEDRIAELEARIAAPTPGGENR